MNYFIPIGLFLNKGNALIAVLTRISCAVKFLSQPCIEKISPTAVGCTQLTRLQVKATRREPDTVCAKHVTIYK